eukprot:2903432-Prymnesium_polylepis.1
MSLLRLPKCGPGAAPSASPSPRGPMLSAPVRLPDPVQRKPVPPGQSRPAGCAPRRPGPAHMRTPQAEAEEPREGGKARTSSPGGRITSKRKGSRSRIVLAEAEPKLAAYAAPVVAPPFGATASSRGPVLEESTFLTDVPEWDSSTVNSVAAGPTSMLSNARVPEEAELQAIVEASDMALNELELVQRQLANEKVKSQRVTMQLQRVTAD